MELKREHFHISRAAEYFDLRELQAQTGQPVHRFGEVVLKELIDNALDACESAGVSPVIHIGVATEQSRMIIYVSDNGNGISEAVINSILNYDTRTSDKAAYKAPTRGAQGNAFKTIVGIPHALGGGSVTIESQGLRHTITATATPAGTIDISHEVTAIDYTQGTAVYVDMPVCSVRPYWYARAAALLNPHAAVKICDFNDFDDLKVSVLTFYDELQEWAVFYKCLSECKKIRPNDLTSVHWYNSGDFYKLTYMQGKQHDIPLGEFIRQFKGLSTGKAKAIKSQVSTDYKRVSDICKDKAAVEAMRLLMQSESKPILSKALGAVGETAFLSRLNVKRHWYRQVTGTLYNMPYLFEILIAETPLQGGYYFGVNHSPTFGDYLTDSYIIEGELSGAGIKSALDAFIDKDSHIVIAHLIEIGLPFLDRSKSSLAVPEAMADDIGKAVWGAAKVLYKEHKARQKDIAKQDRLDNARLKEVKPCTIKDAVFKMLPDAIQRATDNERLPANVRALYYKVRDAIQAYTTKELDYNYFSQDLLIQYWQEQERNPLIYNDARGVLYAPHSEEVLQLGTFEVDRYIFPEHEYNKVLYIEKKGLWHTIKAANLHKKYDMAVIAGEGYSSEAIRLLLAKAQTGRDYTIFVLHDADPDGYNIARTIQAATKRMPDHHIEVIDLGLKVQDAVDMNLSSETFTRKKELAGSLDLNDIELEYFGGELKFTGTKKSWVCQRIELNAMSAGELVDYIDAGISQAIERRKLDKKVIPPEVTLNDRANDLFRRGLNAKVEETIRERLGVDDIKTRLLESLGGTGIFYKQAFKPNVEQHLIDNELDTWGDSLQIVVDAKLNELGAVIDLSIDEELVAATKPI